MDTNNTRTPTVFHTVYECILKSGMLVVAFNTIVLSFYRFYDLRHCETLRDVNYALFSLLALAVAGYAVLCRFKYPDAFTRMKAGLRRLLCPEFMLLLLLFIWALIGLFVNGSYSEGNLFKDNRQALFDTALSFFVFFPLPFLFSRQRFKAAFHAMTHFLTAVLTPLMLYVLWEIFHNRWIHFAGGAMGMSDEIRLILNSHPNTAGAYAAMMLMLCIYMIITQRLWLKAFYALAFGIHSLILFYSNSRTCFIAVAVCAAASLFFLIWHVLIKRRMIVRLCVCLLASLLFFFAYDAARTASFDVFESVTHLSEILARQKAAPVPAPAAPAAESTTEPAVMPSTNQLVSSPVVPTPTVTYNSERDFDIGGSEMRSRYDMWACALKSMTYDIRHAVFGVTPASVFDAIKEMSNGKYPHSYTHNQFLEIGVIWGWPGLFLFILYMLLTAFNCLKTGLSQEKHTTKGFYVIPLTILMVVVCNLTEANLLFYHYFSGTIFFLLCGWVTLESRGLSEFPPFKMKRKK